MNNSSSSPPIYSINHYHSEETVIFSHQDKVNVCTLPSAETSVIPRHPDKFNVCTLPSAETSVIIQIQI